jgi:hypothetical protein
VEVICPAEFDDVASKKGPAGAFSHLHTHNRETSDTINNLRHPEGIHLTVKIGSQNRVFSYDDSRTMHYIGSELLREILTCLTRDSTILEVAYQERRRVIYHQYTGGPNWIPTVPSDVANPGEVLKIWVKVLTPENFVERLPRFTLANYRGAGWMTDLTQVSSFKLEDGTLRIELLQDPEVEDISSYTIVGVVSRPIGFNKGDAFLQFGIQDVFGEFRSMRVYYNRQGSASLGIQAGASFLHVESLSFDGVRYRLAYDDGGLIFNIANIYVVNPSTSYSLGPVDYDVPVGVEGETHAFRVKQVVCLRRLEKAMLQHGSDYDLGRLGAEISYAVGREKLDLAGLVISEPTKGGPDLFTRGGEVVIQVRLLARTQAAITEKQLIATLQTQVVDLYRQLRNTFESRVSARKGYLMITYLHQGELTTLVFEVPKQKAG